MKASFAHNTSSPSLGAMVWQRQKLNCIVRHERHKFVHNEEDTSKVQDCCIQLVLQALTAILNVWDGG